MELNQAWRNRGFTVTWSDTHHCDREPDNQYSNADGWTEGWYRFTGDAGTKLANECVQPFHCGSYANMWLSDPEPAEADGSVDRQVCVSSEPDCCVDTLTVKVLNCGSHFLYYLPQAPACYATFCGDN
ncbi:oncoprotein-induced transcript 3 protein [Lingula anatina]|uniref:Oncoprotein-induced transcript 3 protein n=1 Tax=Lingula anatina TaxID=7574 RepID=A0A1S3HK96_LINAN|nr:oncoprotein-induced transcript 3 protein [Lingula anatina]|eukprot:XP_013385881.1 oncoprotein-induced transcript 3 protein [Lingula anatina]